MTDTPKPRERAADLDIEAPPPVPEPAGDGRSSSGRSGSGGGGGESSGGSSSSGSSTRRRRRRGGSGRSRSGGASPGSAPQRDASPAAGEDSSDGGRTSSSEPDKPRKRREDDAGSSDDASRSSAKEGSAEGDGEKETSGGGEAGSRSGRSRSRSRSRRGRPSKRPRGNADRVMLVHADPAGSQIAVLEDNKIVEHYVARAEDISYVGNVYLGKVQNVLPGMEASFIDIGEARNGVLYAGEVGIAGDEGEEVPRIETVLKSGQPIIVQVTKDPMRSKGARLTALVSLAGRHLVLVPNAKSLGVSRRLSDSERSRLRTIAQGLDSGNHGIIVRTAAEGASQEEIQKDLARLIETWKEIEKRSKQVKAPALLYSEPELELRVIRDLFNRDVVRCVVDDRELEQTLRRYVQQTSPDLDERLELYDGELPIFEEFRVLEQIRKSLDRKVWLPSGGHLVIDRTEAMTVVDVNTGKFVGRSSLEETVFKTNKEAAVEMARQLRLRDIGGIIVIDFIDMEEASNRDELLRVFRHALEADRTRNQVFEISPLGLVQMTRKNVSAGIVEAFSQACATCEGRGILVHDVD